MKQGHARAKLSERSMESVFFLNGFQRCFLDFFFSLKDEFQKDAENGWKTHRKSINTNRRKRCNNSNTWLSKQYTPSRADVYRIDADLVVVLVSLGPAF